MAKKKLESSIYSNINICLRKSKTTKNVTVGDILNKNYLNQLIRNDEGYSILKNIRNSPSYWQQKMKDLLAMIRQLGKPTIFLTLSAGETNWPELIQHLYKFQFNKNINLNDAINLDKFTKTDLIKNDSVTCARYFDYKIHQFMNLIKKKTVFLKNIMFLIVTRE